jgi:type I restriction enzyme S subunit
MTHDVTGWDDVSIEEFGEIIAGGTPSRVTPSFWNGSIPWVTPGEITNLKSKYVQETRESITPEGLAGSAAKLLPVGSVLVTTRATLGEAAIAAVPLTTNQGFKSIIPNEDTDSLFAYYQIRTLQPEMVRLASGTTFLEISKADFCRIRTIRPKRDEQSRIAAVLDTVDEAIAKTEAVIAKLTQVRAGLLHDLLTRGLDEHGQLRDPIAHPEQFQDSPLGRIPREWETGPLGLWIESSAFGPRFSGEHYDPQGNVATLRTTDMDSEGNLDLNGMPFARLDLEAYRSHILKPGDVLVSRSGTCGITAVFQGFHRPVLPGAFLIRFRPTTALLPEFMRIYLNWPTNRARILLRAEGGVQKNLRSDSILDLPVALPVREEQAQILSMLKVQNCHIEQETEYLAKLTLLKSGLVTDLLTGRVRVPEEIAVVL